MRLADGRDASLRQAAARDRRGPRPLPMPGAGRSVASICAPSTTRWRIRAHLGRAAASPSSAAASSGSNLRQRRASAAPTVTVIEAQPRILMRGVPSEIAAIVAGPPRAPRASTSASAPASQRIERRRDRRRARSTDGSRSRPTLVVAGIGAMPRRHSPKPPGSRSTTASRSTEPAHLRPGHLRRRRLLLVSAGASMTAGASGSKPGATRRTRARSPPATCSAPARPMLPCRGSGPTSTT